MIELAKRVVACKNWRWMSGMLLMSDPEKGPCGTELPNWSVNLRVRVTDAPDNRWEGVAQYSAEYPDVNFVTVLHDELPNPLPDLTDPATLGCLLALVREVWSCPSAYARLTSRRSYDDESAWEICDLYVDRRPTNCWGFGSEAEALVFALENAPNQSFVRVICLIPAYVHKSFQAHYGEHRAWRCVEWDDRVELGNNTTIQLTRDGFEVLNDDRYNELAEDDEGSEVEVQQCYIGIRVLALVYRKVPKSSKPDFWKDLDWNLQYKDYDVDIALNPETVELVEIQDLNEVEDEA